MDSWPPKDASIIRAVLPVLATGLIGLAGWVWAESNQVAVDRAEFRRLQKDFASMEVKLDAANAGRFEDVRKVKESLNEIRVTLARMEERQARDIERRKR
jgi:hypothetical protein